MRRDRTSRGQTLVEFALILPTFVLLLVGIFDLGRAVYAYNTINNAAREAGRLAIVDQTIADIQQQGAQHAASLAVAATDIQVDFRDSSTPEDPGSCDLAVGTQAVVGCYAVVSVPYQYSAATPIIGDLVGVIQMVGETRFRVEFSCVDGGGQDCPLGD